jgi:hypothetical protein
LNLKYDNSWFQKFAFKFNLCRYTKAAVDDLIVDGKLEDQTRVPINPKAGEGGELDAMKEALEAEVAKKEAKLAKKKKKEAKAAGGSPDENGADKVVTRDGNGAKIREEGGVELVRGTGIMSSTLKREWNGCDDLSHEQLKSQAKRWRAADHAPEGTNKDVYASLFTGTDAHKREQETYLSRNARAGH